MENYSEFHEILKKFVISKNGEPGLYICNTNKAKIKILKFSEQFDVYFYGDEKTLFIYPLSIIY